MTTTTSPVLERTLPEKASKGTLGGKKLTESMTTRNSNAHKKVTVCKTVEIKEDQNEDEEQEKKNPDVNREISPSA